MKKKFIVFLTIIVFLLLGYIGLVFLKSEDSGSKVNENVIKIEEGASEGSLASIGEELLEEVSFGKRKYRYYVVKADTINSLRLYTNFSQKTASEGLIQRKQCKMMVNGGFYDREGQPIGWFVSEGEEVSDSIKSGLLNGFLSVTYDDEVEISTKKNLNDVRIGLQSGPMLIENGKGFDLKIKNDEFRRRVVALINEKDELLFMVIVGEDSFFEGPMLADLPRLVISIIEKEGEEVVSGFNLDGGSASVFYSEKIYIKEASWIGSYFCLRG